MVNRNDRAVTATVIGGRVVFRGGQFVDGYGRDWRSGQVLRAGRRSAAGRRAAAQPALR
jgi:N-acyl-D-aspartate/D-glutamate deacylase